MLRKMRRQQEARPRTHDRKVMTGRVGSSVSGTTRATSSTEQRSSDGSSPPPLNLSAAEESWLGGVFEDIEKALMGETEKQKQRSSVFVVRLCVFNLSFIFKQKEEKEEREKSSRLRKSRG